MKAELDFLRRDLSGTVRKKTAPASRLQSGFPLVGMQRCLWNVTILQHCLRVIPRTSVLLYLSFVGSPMLLMRLAA